jgi:hypothetical protein
LTPHHTPIVGNNDEDKRQAELLENLVDNKDKLIVLKHDVDVSE